MKIKITSEIKKKMGIVISPKSGTSIDLSKIDPADKPHMTKSEAERQTEKLRARLLALQQILYAEHARSVLIVVQAMDTGGKDGSIKKICSGLDPNGVHLTNFKYPSSEEMDHDFLWRVHHAVPRKGVIGIWNRSHYEDVLVPRVHKLISKDTWRDRCEDINAFGRLLIRNGTTVLKFFLHISKDEQKKRLQDRLQDPTKLWKFNPGDLKERELWEDYQKAYEAVIEACSTNQAPWHIVPADRKWVRNLSMLEIIVNTIEKMNPQYAAPAFDPKAIVIE